MGKNATIGTDPEFFLVDKKTGKYISAIPHIEGTKHNPAPLPSGGSVQHDNVALEFATDPTDSKEGFVNVIRNAFKDINSQISEDHDIVAIPSATFESNQLEHPEAQEFGCDPDYDAWTIAINNKPTSEDQNFRSCGGHIHVGHVEGDGNDFLLDPYGKVDTVKMMDFVHGIISTILDNSKAAIERRKLYGKAGCHRPTSYGVEYRVLSNYWLKSPQLVMMVYSLTQDVLRLIRDDVHLKLIDSVGSDRIQTVINDGLVDEALVIFGNNVKPVLSEESLHYVEECMKEINNYNFKKEWEIEA